jgi:Lipopolysaccharide-assembly
MVGNGTRRWRRLSLAIVAGAMTALILPACSQDGHFSILGYTTAPNYDTTIKTVEVPIFENRSYQRGLEFDLTRAVVREIEAKTPFKVVQCNADTKLTGVITSFQENYLLANPLNEARQKEVVMIVELTWTNLHTGEVLSRPSRRPGMPIEEPAPFSTPGVNINAGGMTHPPTVTGVVPPDDTAILPPQLDAAPKPPVLPVTIRSSSNLLVPELGYSLATAQKQCVDKMAIQIISLMEKPW